MWHNNGTMCQSQFLILEGRRFGLGLAYVTHRADHSDSGSNLVSVPLIFHSTSDPFHSSHLVFTLLVSIIAVRVMYHSCSLIRSFGFHMFLTSFPFHSKTVQLYRPPVSVVLVLQSWNRLDFRFPLSSRPWHHPRRSSSLPFLLPRCVNQCHASTLPHSPSSSRTHR
jgi:hypothetical protein